MEIYQYKDYDEYITSQRRGYETKKERQWANEPNIKFISDCLQEFAPQNGICHGTRSGKEQQWFMKYLKNCTCIGTEIGDTKEDHIVNWDFNQNNPVWEKKFDFLYSNAFDHAFNPATTLQTWEQQVKDGGYILLEWSCIHEHSQGRSATATDPVAITLPELLRMIGVWIDGKVVEIFNLPVVRREWQVVIFIKIGQRAC
jgi:hypothetical protein